MRVERVVAPVREQILTNLRNAIIEMRFRPGDRLVERQLCDLTGASRTSVREALRQLESEGLIRTSSKGPVVASVSPEEARHLYEVRAVLEGLAGQLFAERADADQVAALRRAVSEIEEAGADPHALLAAKNRFYGVLFEGARNPVIGSTLGLLHARVSVLRATSLSQPGRPVETLREMRNIVAAIEARRSAEAGDACRIHVENAARTAIEALTRQLGEEPSPQEGDDRS